MASTTGLLIDPQRLWIGLCSISFKHHNHWKQEDQGNTNRWITIAWSIWKLMEQQLTQDICLFPQMRGKFKGQTPGSDLKMGHNIDYWSDLTSYRNEEHTKVRSTTWWCKTQFNSNFLTLEHTHFLNCHISFLSRPFIKSLPCCGQLEGNTPDVPHTWRRCESS